MNRFGSLGIQLMWCTELVSAVGIRNWHSRTAAALLATVLATTLLVSGCGGGTDDQAAGQANAASTSWTTDPGADQTADQTTDQSVDQANPPPDISLLAVAPTLGTAQSFAVLGGATVTNTGPTVITGNLGVSPGTAITGFPPGIVNGETHAADAVALQAQSDTTIAYDNLAGQACDTDLTGQDLGGMTLVPGVYCFSSSAQLTGTLALDAGGDSAAVWVFQIGSTLTTASISSVLLTNGADPCNVYWQIGSSATLGTGTEFAGNILALTSITLTTSANLTGRALARNGAVTMDTNNVNASVCGAPSGGSTPPTVDKSFSPDTFYAGGISTLTITLSNANATAADLTAWLIDNLPDGVVIAATPNAATTCGGTLKANAGDSVVKLMGGSIPANGFCTVTVDVTAPVAGCFENVLSVGALQTSNGNNALTATAKLTVF